MKKEKIEESTKFEKVLETYFQNKESEYETEYKKKYNKETEEILKRDEWKNWDGVIRINMDNINEIRDTKFRNFIRDWYSRNFVPGDLVTGHDIGWALIEYRNLIKIKNLMRG